MASIFLSYVREDADKARALAAILERAGHSVWWDRRIKGGAQYSAEIESALNAADKVVVLWSARSVGSAWVRDEAAAGRDRGCLVPLALDSTKPPLGFRQFQTIDLSSWKGRSHSAPLSDLLEAVGEETRQSPSAQPEPQPPRWPRQQFRVPRFAVIALPLLVAALIGGGWWWSQRGASHVPVVAIDTESGTPQSQEAARQLAVRLGTLQTDSLRLISGKGDADLVLRVNAVDNRSTFTRDLTVLSGHDGSILWTTSLQQPADRAGDLSQQLTLASERVVACALEALSDRRDRIDPATLRLYLAGCSRLQDVYGMGLYDGALIKTLEQVTRKAPHFEGAWAKLLAAESDIVRSPDTPPQMIALLRGHLREVKKLGLNPGEVYAASASLLPQSDFGAILDQYDRGIRVDPDNALLYRLRAEQLQRVGRMNEAIADADQALQLDPLSPALQDIYISALAYAGKVDAAYEQLRNAEAMWPDARNIQMARYRLDLRFGDPKAALAFYRNSGSGIGDPAQEIVLLARIDPTPANIQRAINEEQAGFAAEPRYIAGVAQALAQFGRKDEAIDALLNYKRVDAIGFNAEVMFRPAFRDVWRDPRSMAAAAHLGFLSYWKKSGKWPDFCSDPTLPYDCRKEAAKYAV